MQENAGSVITDAYQKIVTLAGESEVEPEELQSGIRWLNRMMAKWAAAGTNLGFTDVENTRSPMTVPLGAIAGVIDNLALTLWPMYVKSGDTPPARLVEDAKEGKAVAVHIGGDIGASNYPSTLPRGSGNEGFDGDSASHFYPDQFGNILSEDNGSIALEDGTGEDVG